MEFPHLNDTQFPMLNNVNVYSYRNEFDYTRWIVNTKVKLTNVLWNSDYRDVVKFENNIVRDRWFDEHVDYYEVTLKANHSIPPEGGIKLPIPYDVAVRYNYMVVDIPVMTSVQQPIEYEDLEAGIRRWYFFVDEVSNRAPNTTMFNISLDVWTQFHNDVEINYLFLERGHAPVAATNVNTYLANPIENNDYLLTPDVTPTAANVVRKANYIPFGNGEKWFCIATNLNRNMLANLGSILASSEYTYGNISYSNADSRDGYQLIVNGYGVGNGEDWSSLKLDAVGTACDAAHHRIQNDIHVFALPASEVHGSGWSSGAFFYDVMQTCPNLMNGIQGVFVVDRAMLNIDLSKNVTVAGHTLYVVDGGTEQVDSIPRLTVADFDFPERYQRFAKLYTYPYSTIQLTDNEGETVDVRIENTGSMTVHRIAQLAFPFINTRIFFTGINGVGSQSYTWKLLNGNNTTAEIYDGDWFDCCFDHEIPCYALFMDGESAWYLDNFNRAVRSGRRNALVAYHNSVRIANTTKENTEDANDTSYSNTSADATTMNTNATNTINTTRDNMDATIATNTAKVARANNLSSHITQLGNAKNDDVMEYANYASSITSSAQNETTAAVSKTSANGAISSAAAGGLVGGALYAVGTAAMAGAGTGAAAGSVAAPGAGTLAGAAIGIAAGATVGLAQALISASVASDNASTVIQGNLAAVNASNSANRSTTAETNQYNESVTYDMNDQRTQDINADSTLLNANTDRNNANLRTNTANNAATMLANMNRSRNTGNANAGYTRDSLVNNAKETLENSRNNIQWLLADAANAPARQIGNYAGNPTADYMRTRGVQIKVRTMPNAEVRQVGDWFARYGYSLEQVWDVNESGLCPMQHFCYWKCRDIWIDDRKSSNNAAVVMLSTMFERGVTIWKNPEEVGKVSIYDNFTS